MSRRALGISEALHNRPLVPETDDPDSPWTLAREIPAQLSILLSQRIPPFEAGCAFLSPIDYARHGGNYRIVPGIASVSRAPTGTIRLLIRQDVRTLRRVAVDVRVTSEIVLLKILLLERFPDLTGREGGPEFVALTGSPDEQLQKADAALLVSLSEALPARGGHFSLDLVEEWVDMTDLPYPHGFWVGHEDALDGSLVQSLVDARTAGVSGIDRIAEDVSRTTGSAARDIQSYLSAFTYELNDEVQDSTSEFFRYAYYHGILGDIPDLKFAE